jgi:tight adherence protein C
MIAEPVVLLSALVTALAAGLVARAIVPPPRRLRDRLMPYVAPVSFSRPTGSGVSAAVFGPIVRDMADWIGRMADRTGGEVTTLKLRQAGWFKGADGHALVSAYRMVLLRNMALAAAAALVVGYALNASVMLRLALVALAFIFGATRVRGKLEKAIDTRRELMRIEIYTVNQLLAMRVRAGGGVIQAVKSVTRRGSGEVVGELEEALRLHRAGWSGPDAFRRIAELTPEPFCGRTYRLLAAAEERGADLAGALLALSDDVRETRRESIKRTATKRRAAMLIPTIAILAPVLILFVAAPLPYLITGWQ